MVHLSFTFAVEQANVVMLDQLNQEKPVAQEARQRSTPFLGPGPSKSSQAGEGI